MVYMIFRRIVPICFVLLFFGISGFSQQTASHYDPEKKYLLAWELFRKEKYSAARALFDEFISNPGNASNESISNARYYKALCAGELYHPEAINEIRSFVEDYPVSLKEDLANFEAGKIFYRNRKYRKSVTYFENTDISYLKNEEISEYWFKKGYCYFRLKEYDKASQSFHEILNIDSKYRTAATYYYGHVAYQQNNLNTAIETFDKLKDSKTFKPILPYYYVQIYYEQEKYDDVIRYTDSISINENVKYNTEIKRYVAESHYKLGHYEKALEMLLYFQKNFPRLSREDYYQIAFCYYRTNRFDEAIPYFERVVNIKDELQQVAYFNLADCFLKKNNRQSARNAFQFASKSEYNKTIKEESLFAFSKLSFELDFQTVAISSLQSFIEEFPESTHLDEANEILAQLYITTKNYKDALIALDKIKDKTPRAKLAYQKVAYFRAIEFFNDREYDAAIGLFTKAIINDEDALIRASAMYWKAEAFFNKGEYEQARKQYRIYFFNPPSTNTDMYHISNYNLGYCHFKLKSYSDANTWFRKYIRKKDETDNARYSDALIRIGDGFFILKDYSNAMSYYDKAIIEKAKATPYCLFQKGMIQGIKGNMQGKADAMDNIINDHGNSQYTADAMFEKGNALMALDKNEEANKFFRQVIKKYPNSAYAKKALLKSALIQYNLRNDEKALAIYKDVVNKYPSTPEATEALTGVRNLYISMGKPQEYFDYIKNISSVNISNGAQDSITYEAAEQLYLKSAFNAAANGFSDYIQNFPNGYFILNASYYKSECSYMSGDLDKALEGYLVVTNSSRNIFTEKSLLKAGEILVKKESCVQAIKIYSELEQLADFHDNIISAQVGLMRCYHLMEDPDNTMIYARKLITGDKISNPTLSEANLLYARSAMMKNDLDEAEKHFKIVAKTPSSEAGAESKYSLALIYFKKNNYKQSQGECYQVINQVPSYEYWIGKSFLLLGDNYLALKDTFQAKHTYKSIIDNYQGDPSDKDDLISIAQTKFNALIEIEDQIQQEEILKKEEDFYNAEEDSTETILQPNE